MRLQFLGSGDAFGSGGRFNTCFHLERANRGNVLIDCGASSMVAIRKWGVDPNAISTVLVTHLHGDHFGGLPFFLLDAQLVSRRTTPLTLAGPPGFRERLQIVREAMFAGSTAIEPKYRLPCSARNVSTMKLQNMDTTNSASMNMPRIRVTVGSDSFMIIFSMDSNHRTPKRTDLQSVAVGHLATYPT